MNTSSSTSSLAREKMTYFLECRGKLIALLLVFMFILWLVTISTTHIIQFPPDPFYYVKELPASYWAGMALAVLVLTLLVHKPLPRMKVIAEMGVITILILYLFGTPCFIYSNPRFQDVYEIADLVNWINTTGHLTGMIKWYLTDWPMATVSFSVGSQILGINVLSFGQYYPIFSMFLLTLLLYILAKKVTSEYCLIAPVAYMSFAWPQAYQMVPQYYTLLLSVLLIFLLLSLKDSAFPGYETTKIVLILTIWFVMVLAHGASPLLNLIALVSMLLIYNLIKRFPLTRGKHPWGESSPRIQAITAFIIPFAVAFLFYAFFEAEFLGIRMVSWLQITIENILNEETFLLTGRYVTTPAASYTMLSSIRLTTSLGILVLGSLSSLHLFLKGKSGSFDLTVVGFFVGYMGLACYLIISHLGIYGTNRAYIFGLIPASVLFAMMVGSTFDAAMHKTVNYSKEHLLKRRWRFDKLYPAIFSRVILLFIIVSMLAFPITKYGSDLYGFMPESELAARLFVDEHPEAIGIRQFESWIYNMFEWKQQEGEKYRSNFISNDLNMIYNSGQSQIYLPISPKLQ
ncbi:hypothetical protein ACFLUF_02320 [Chloroflexota bacterium]